MSKEIFPSSFECDCEYQSDFFESTVREMKAMSHKKKVRLGDAAPEEHMVVFHKGEMVELLCLKQSRSIPVWRKLHLKGSSERRLTSAGEGSW